MPPVRMENASTDFIHRLSLDEDESDYEDSSNSSSPCKSIRNAQLSRKSSIFGDAPSKINTLNSYSFSSALEHAGRATPRRDFLEYHSLLNLRKPSFSMDDPYSPLQSPTDSVQSLTSISSYGTAASMMSELDSDAGTELETDTEGGSREDGDTTEVDPLCLTSFDDETLGDLVDSPSVRPLSRPYALGHRANRSVLGISYGRQLQPAEEQDEEDEILRNNMQTRPSLNSTERSHARVGTGAKAETSAANHLAEARSRSTSARQSLWMPPAKVRRTQSMFATPEQMLHEQQLGNFERSPACQAGVQGVSFLDSADCPIPTFTVRQDPFPRITHETLCQLIDGEYKDLYPEVLVIDCRFEYEYEGGHIEGAINVNSKQQLEQALFNDRDCENSPGNKLLVFHCEYSAYRSPLLASHLRYCDRRINAARYPRLYYPDVLVLDGGYSQFYTAASHRCIPQNYVGMNHQAHQNTCQREMSKFRNGMKARKFQSIGAISSPQLSSFKFPSENSAFRSSSVVDLHTQRRDDAGQLSPRHTISHHNSIFGI